MNGQAGKGDASRPFSVSLDEYGKRFDSIDWSKGRPSGVSPKAGTDVVRDYTTKPEWVIPDLKDIFGPTSQP